MENSDSKDDLIIMHMTLESCIDCISKIMKLFMWLGSKIQPLNKNLVKVYPIWKNRVPGIFNKQRRYDFQTDLCWKDGHF